MTTPRGIRPSRHLLGHLATGAVLVGIAFALLAWQRGPLGWGDPGPSRILGAAIVALVYVTACALFAWSRRRAARASATGRDVSIAVKPVAVAANASAPATTATTSGVAVASGVASHAVEAAEPPLLVAYASQTGFAEQIAGQTADSLRDAGVEVRLVSFAQLDEAMLVATRRALFVASTTGEGDAPDSAIGVVGTLMQADLDLSQLTCGVLALGDSEYVNYCAFGHQVDQWLRRCGATALFDPVEVDNGDDGALRHWQHQVGLLADRTDMPDWETPRYASWRLVERVHLNPGSLGDPCFHLALRPDDPAQLRWEAGDIAEIGPRHGPQAVASWLAAVGLDGSASVADADSVATTLADRLAASVLPTLPLPVPFDAASVAAGLVPLPHREYSIASMPADGAIHLLLRQMRRPDGSLGIGGGWLTAYAPIGASIALRLRANSNFHVPGDARPLILIGNGTGLAGLRALLKARIAAGHRRNWLVFGERNAAIDYHYRDDLERWQAEGAIERLDLAFSRDEPRGTYVQQRLREAADTLRTWIDDGASIYVCGSLQGMAPGVDAALREVLGSARVDALTAAMRYRRDVY